MKPQDAVDTWNSKHKIGQPVIYRRGSGELVETKTRTEASVLSGHTAVVWLDGIAGCVALTHVTPREEPKDWVIRKRGYFYRPNSQGYTASIHEAGRYTETEAKAEVANEPETVSAHLASKFTETVHPWRAALERIERWFGEFPATGRFWQNPDGTDTNREMSYASCWGSNGERDYMRGIARKALAASEPPPVEGWKLVPIEPTQDMVHAAHKSQPGSINCGFAAAYRTMIEAAPKP